ncbi:MAG: hypothetical protein JJE52_12320 [Acidimicrobiia bacterium]|nr:hypothetical protein [Acidimicrobiia bacterium]
MSMDDHFNAAARGVRDQVAHYPVPALEPDTEPKGSPARYAPTAVFAALALLLGGLVVANGGISGDGDGDGDGPVADPTAEELAGVDDSFNDPGLAVAGPRDGKDSVGLPIVVSPAEGLSDGQTVTVSGSGFPANDRLGAVICAHNGPAGAGAGVANCQTGTVTYVDSSAAGAFQVEVSATRFIEIAGVGVDCAAPPPVGQPSTCVLAVGSLADYDLSGNTPIWFDADLSVATVPAFEVTPSEGLTGAQEVVMRLTNVAPRSE